MTSVAIQENTMRLAMGLTPRKFMVLAETPSTSGMRREPPPPIGTPS